MRAVHEDTRAISRTALIAALRPDHSEFVQIVRAESARIDWFWVLERASAHKVVALLAARVDECGLAGAVEQAVAVRLAKVREDVRQRMGWAQATLLELTERFAQTDIPFMVVKGSVLSETVYRDPCARRFFDVDVVVRPDTVMRAEAALRSLGYRLGQVDKLLTMRSPGGAEKRFAEAETYRFYRRFEYELPFVPPTAPSRLAVDLHWHVARRSRMRISADDLWRYTIPVAVAGTQVTTLTPPATLIHLAIHATTCSFAGFRLLHLCDLAWAATRLRTQCRDLWTVAQEWGASAHLDSVLEMTERVLGVALPIELRHVGRQPRRIARPGFQWVARDAFLVDNAVGGGSSLWRRAWMEVLWSIAMGCLSDNLLRSVRVRWTRLRWQWQRRRLPVVES
jgi:putative nucleotidyltransferase-like protein